MLDASTRWLGVCVGQGISCFTRSFGLSNEGNDNWGKEANEDIEDELVLSNPAIICWIEYGGGILSDGACGTWFCSVNIAEEIIPN